MEETELRARLESLAQHTAPPPRHVDDLAAEVAGLHRATRRRHQALAAMAAVAAVVLVTIPVLRSALDRDSQPATPSETSVDVYGGPTRGSLAGDGSFVAGLAGLPWASEDGDPDPAPPEADRHVVWAGVVNHHRWALVAGPSAALVEPSGGPGTPTADEVPGGAGSMAVAWFVGPEDATAEDMTVRSVSYGIPPDQPAALTDGAAGVVVIVGGPEDRLEVSKRPRIADDGSISRSYESVPAWRGVATIFDGEGPALRYRVLRDGSWVTGVPAQTAEYGDFVPDISVDRLRPAPPSAPGDAAVQPELGDVLLRTGLSPDQVTVSVVWAGDVPLETGNGSARATLMAAELPSGAFYVTAVVGWDAGDGDLRSAPCASLIRPAGVPIDQQLFVLGCDDIGAGQEVPFASLVVVAPRGTATAEALTPEGDVKYSYTLVDGVTVAAAPTGVTDVQVLDASGTVVGHGHPQPPVDLGD